DRLRVAVVDLLDVECDRDALRGLDRDADRPVGRNVEVAVLGVEALVFLKLRHLHLGLVRGADGEPRRELAEVADSDAPPERRVEAVVRKIRRRGRVRREAPDTLDLKALVAEDGADAK